ncbi:MAG: MarR family transcriptional regulator [Actinobacteria bacterium]|nr:MAG: MarR family transcriptional regulator [Actinomycetota bacterium]
MSTQAFRAREFAAWTRFLRAYAAVTRDLSARLEAQHGLSLRDFDVLVQLYSAPERRMRRIDLARTVILSPSGITRLLEGLERAGWVSKHQCESDARVTWAVLTDAGAEKFEQASESHAADVEELFASRFNAEEEARLAELLGRLPLADAGACNA